VKVFFYTRDRECKDNSLERTWRWSRSEMCSICYKA